MTVIEAAIYMARKGFRVFPLVGNTKLPAIKNFSSLATTDEIQIKKWFNSANYNIGISTDELLVVDVDTKTEGKNGVLTIEKLNEAGKIFPPTAQQRTTTNGMHLLYRAPFPIRNSVSKLGPGLDVRGKGGYVVGMGSTINGIPYRINKHPVVDAPEWLVELCEAAREEQSKAHEIAAHVPTEKALARGKKYLESLEAITEGGRNDAAYKVANKLKDIGVSKEDMLLLMFEDWKCEPALDPTELGAAIASAFKYGKDAQGSASPEALFAQPISPSHDRPGTDDNGVHPLAELNKEYAFVMLGGKHRILYETTDSDNNFKTEFLEEQTFHAKLSPKTFQSGDGNILPLSRLWIKDRTRRTYDGLVFKPERPTDPRFYNLWRGFKVDPLKPGELITDTMKRGYESFQEHLFNNVVDRNEDHKKWVMGWLAHMIQKPWEKPGTALVLRGKKGVGKNAIFETFRGMFPDHYLVSGDRRYLVSNFNGHLERLLLFVADEAFWSGDKASEGILKSLITDNRINIEKKGKDATSIESCHRIAVLGNEKWVIPASHDERRYAVFNMGESRKQDHKFFGQMASDMDKGALRYLFTELKSFDLKSVNVKQIPMTRGLLEQKKNSQSIFHEWWHACLDAGNIKNVYSFNDEDKIWPTQVSKESLREAFDIYARRRGRDRFLESDQQFLNSLREICSGIKSDGPNLCIPTLKECRNLWDKYMTIPEEWES